MTFGRTSVEHATALLLPPLAGGEAATRRGGGREGGNPDGRRIGVALSHEDPASLAFVEAGVDPGLRRDDVERRLAADHTQNVIPAKAGTHVSLNACDAGEFRSGENA